MNKKLAIVMDSIDTINLAKDTSLALLLAAQKHNWETWYLEPTDIFFNLAVMGKAKLIKIDQQTKQYKILDKQIIKLCDLDAVLMRKDPPFDIDFLHATHLLAKAQKEGALVVNDPVSLYSFNEKMIITLFPQCIAPTLVSSNQALLIDFINQHQDIVLKPLDGMGGASIFKVTAKDLNINVIIETLTKNQTAHIMAQKFISDIALGDKRVIIVNGKAIPYALARIPQQGEFRGNLAAGAHGKGQQLSTRDLWITEQIAPFLIEKGILFAGIDIIGDYLTEINITSPTGIRELDQMFSLDIAGEIISAIENKIDKK